MRTIVYILTFVSLCSCLASCHRQRPQLPSNKRSEDTTAVALINARRQLVEATDREITQFMTKQDSTFVLNDLGFWYQITSRSSLPRFLNNESVELSLREYDLQGRLLSDIHTTIVIGKRQETLVVDEALLLMRHGEKARIIAPWYLAYDQAGNDIIPPYTNLIIDIQTHE